MDTVVMETILICLSGCISLGFLWVLIKFFNKVWWTPLRIQSAMKSQGVEGPSYKFLHGNAKEIINLKKEGMKRSMELHHQSFPIVQPHIHLWKKIYGNNLLVWKGSTPQLVVTEPELIKEILNNKDGTYLKPESLPYLKKLFGDGLVVTRGEKWFKLRKLANHAFHGESLKRWKKHVGNEIEVFKEFKLLTSEVISRTAFGSSYLEGQRVFDMLTKMLLIFSRNINKARIPVIGQILKTNDDIESEKLEQGIRESIIKIIKKREEAAMQGQMDGIGSDFLGQLVKVYGDPDKRNRITVDDLIDECKNFYIAGQETTLSAITWTVFLLAVHTDWQEKVRTEVLELLGQQNPTAEMISKLKTMNMVINESLRLYPPIVNIVREVQKGVKLANITLPDTMEVHILPLALHYDPVIWGSDVHLFKPERFAEGVAKASNNSSTVSFLPFGLGPRSCVGVNFAYNEIKIALSMILQRYRFTLSPSYVHSPFFLREVWWTPIFMQSMMRKQGIKGPSYRLIHGNTKEIISMRKQSRTNPMEMSHHHILPRIQPQIYSWTKIYGMNFLSWYGTRAQLVVTDIELIKEMLTNKEEIYGKIGFQGYITKLLGDGLVLSRGEKWLKIRKLANHAFHSESLKDMVPAMIKSAEMMLERWRCLDGKEIEVFEEFKVLTSEIISRTAFSSSYLEGEKIFDIYLFRPKDDIEADKLNQGIRDIIINMVNKREREVTIGKQDSYGRDFLGLLLKSMHNPDKTEKITVDDLIDECKNFYVAGHETTTSSLSWTILLLATHMDWQEKARKEVFEIFGKQNPTAGGLAWLKTMTMIINESLRLYPPVFHITRKVKRDVRLGNLVIPQNMEVYVPSLAVHHDQKIWGADAHLFKPERFAEGVAKATNNNASAFLPFGLGPRNCVGLNFAMTEEKIALSMILQRYRFTLSPTYVHSPVDVLTLHPQHGLQIILEALLVYREHDHKLSFNLLVPVYYLQSFQVLKQGMVDPDSPTICYEVTRNNRTSLQIPAWEHQRDHQHEKYSPEFSLTSTHGLSYMLVVSEPELVKEVMNNKDGAILKAMIQDYADKLLGNGLFASQGEKWMKMRKLANHTFHADSLKIMLERWRQEKVQEVEMHQEFKILTSDVISRVVFGFSHLEGKNIFEMVAKLSLIVARNNFKVGIPGIKGIRESIIKIMKKREEEVMLGKRDSYGSDYLGLLLKVHHDNDNSKSISVDDVIDECKSFYVAGYETTSSAITWTIFLLAIHTEWQERAREEVFELFGHQNPTTDGGGRLKTREVRLGKLVIPEKMAVCLPVLALHHDPQIWGEDVHIFKPERFADGVAKATKSCGAAFMPFGMGPRTCVGLNFAFAEIKIALSMILQRYSFTLSPTYVHSPVHILTICPQYVPPQSMVDSSLFTVHDEVTRNQRTPLQILVWQRQRDQGHDYSIKKQSSGTFSSCLVVTEPKMIKEVLNNKDGAFPKTESSFFVKKFLGDGLITSNGEKWMKMRKVVNHAFHVDSLKSMTPAVVAGVEMMLDRWRDHKGMEIDVYEEFRVLTSEVISRTAFGSSYLKGQRIFEILAKTVEIAVRNLYKVRIPMIQYVPDSFSLQHNCKTADEVEAEKLNQQIRNSIIKMIKEREKAAMVEKSNGYGDDALGLLVKAYKDKTMKISVDDVIDECKTFHVAGQDSTSSGLTWTMFLLAMYTDWQDQARKEVLELFGHQNPDANKLGKMKIMTMMINESLRLYPPAVFTMTRKAARETKLGELIIPANMEVFISTLALHHNPEIWGDDVHLFKPERFAGGVAKATNNNIAAFVPFGLGPNRYKFTLSPNYVHSPTTFVTMCPKHGVPVLLHPL
ncbi:hypothetical protein Tsubulata_047559 [Turnera subulata]|uniref:Cytochrome P450 n=1 Tax=Turnera subulata TaxID=218843 RepID=A0A9Q0JFT3_9ROSI|nr:hypothetical protein Tsubulata_047559 [Turnera subulata]